MGCPVVDRACRRGRARRQRARSTARRSPRFTSTPTQHLGSGRVLYPWTPCDPRGIASGTFQGPLYPSAPNRRRRDLQRDAVLCDSRAEELRLGAAGAGGEAVEVGEGHGGFMPARAAGRQVRRLEAARGGRRNRALSLVLCGAEVGARIRTI